MIRAALSQIMKKPAAAHRLGAYIPHIRSGGRMFSVQADLPRLPVPPLSQSLEKYLQAVRPLVPNDDDFNHTKQLVEEFGKAGGLGETLHKSLEQRAQQRDSWLSEWWFNVAYVGYRESVMINVSPGVVFPYQEFSGQLGQAAWGARLLAGMLDYKKMIDTQTLPVEKLGGKPLCMIQYYRILNSCRIPVPEKDHVVCFPPDEPNAPTHVVVVHNGHFFKLELYGQEHKPLSRRQLFEDLMEIMDNSRRRSEHCIGALTAAHRDDWAKAHAALEKDPKNAATLREVERAVLVLCLDQPSAHVPPGSPAHTRSSQVGAQMLHGGGSQVNSYNRWFDKTIQVVVGADGASGMCYEHAPAEGPPVMSLIDHMYTHAKGKLATEEDAVRIESPSKLEWGVITPPVGEAITDASAQIDKSVKDVQLCVFAFDHFGKNFPKSQKMSPDAFIQVSFQLAFYRLYGFTTATYESGSTRRFQLGRTDVIRGCTDASLAFSKAMVDGSMSGSERVRLLKLAIDAHKLYSNETINGQTFDRHLLGLKLTALEQGKDVPQVFMDPTYIKSNHFRMSTSQVPARSACTLLFGPVVPDGYGLCYNPQEQQILFGISSYLSSPETNTDKMVDAVSTALLDMRIVLEENPSSKL